MDHINKDKAIHSLSFGFSMTEKEDRSKKKKKKRAGAEGTTQEVTLNTHF